MWPSASTEATNRKKGMPARPMLSSGNGAKLRLRSLQPRTAGPSTPPPATSASTSISDYQKPISIRLTEQGRRDGLLLPTIHTPVAHNKTMENLERWPRHQVGLFRCCIRPTPIPKHLQSQDPGAVHVWQVQVVRPLLRVIVIYIIWLWARIHNKMLDEEVHYAFRFGVKRVSGGARELRERRNMRNKDLRHIGREAVRNGLPNIVKLGEERDACRIPTAIAFSQATT